MLTDPYAELGTGPGRGVQNQSMVVDAAGNIIVIGTLITGVVLHPATSAVAMYQGLDAADVTVRNQDNDRGRRP